MRVFLSFFIGIFVCISCSDTDNIAPVKLEGNALGTTFHITYFDIQNRDFSYQIDSLLNRINKSLSTYIPSSDISKINRGDTSIVVDAYFKEVFYKSKTIYRATQGFFDPTIGSLVNAYGFGPEKSLSDLNKYKIDSILQFVGFDKVTIIDSKIVKENPSIFLDFTAIAKGYAIDILGRYFETQNISEYLIEIGGEIRVRGDKNWVIAIEHPNFDETQSFQATVTLKNESIATSGNYRKFKEDIKTGQKYVHIINPKTGAAAMSNLLSVSVIAPTDCADVDAYATAFMAMGLEETKTFLKTHKAFKCFMVYSGKEGRIVTFKTENLTLNSQNE